MSKAPSYAQACAAIERAIERNRDRGAAQGSPSDNDLHLVKRYLYRIGEERLAAADDHLHVVAYGSLADGYVFVGPFPCHEDAVAYIEDDHIPREAWNIIGLDKPATNNPED